MATALTPVKQNSAYENAVHKWTQIDLSNVQKQLDEQGTELRREQKQSLTNRRNLAQKTKDFKKLDDDKKLTELHQLLKQYQNEIDSLATKQKKAESYFFGFYRVIAEAPDPTPLLRLSMATVIDHVEKRSLIEEVSQLKEELTRKADYDLMKQRLLENEQSMAELIASKLKQKENMCNALIEEKESNWASISKQHENQIKMLKSSIEELKTTNEVAELQLHSQNKQIDQSTPSSSSAMIEVDLMSRELESWKKRVFVLEKRNETLRTDLAASNMDSLESTIRQEYGKKLSDLESENVILLANLRQARENLKTLSKEKEETSSIQADLMQQRLHELKTLEERLKKVDDYEEIKEELSLMRQFEFGEEGDNEGEGLDSLLMKRNKEISKELISYRSEHDELVKKVSSLENCLKIVTTQLEAAQAMNLRLESDLANIQEPKNLASNDNASILSSRTHGTRNSINGTHSPDDASILPIITKQRDRFREQNKSLHDELRLQQTLVNDLKRKNSQLQADNEELYEKTRYVASLKTGNNDYRDIKSSTSRESSRNLLTPKTNVKNLENPYHTSYESKLHPIERFRQMEQERVNSRLSPLERLFIFVTRSVLATRTTRMLFLIYCVCLHCIVMFTTVHTMSLNARMIPEVGLSHSTGGIADANHEKLIQEAPI